MYCACITLVCTINRHSSIREIPPVVKINMRVNFSQISKYIPFLVGCVMTYLIFSNHFTLIFSPFTIPKYAGFMLLTYLETLNHSENYSVQNLFIWLYITNIFFRVFFLHIEVMLLLPDQRYTYRVLQTIQMKLILLCLWAELVVLGSTKTALKSNMKFR